MYTRKHAVYLLQEQVKLHKQRLGWSLWGHARWREPAAPLDGVRSSWRALGRWQKRDNKSKQMDMRPLFTQDPAKGKCIVSYSEATAPSNNGPIFI